MSAQPSPLREPPPPYPAASLLDALATPVWAASADGTLIYANRSARTLFGAPGVRSSLLTWPTRLEESAEAAFRAKIAERLAKGGAFTAEVKVSVRSRPRIVRMTFTPDRDAEGQLVWRGEAFPERDKTAAGGRGRLADELDAILKSDPGAMIISDAEGRIVRAGGACRRLTGYAPKELTGVGITTLLPAFDPSGPRSSRPIVKSICLTKAGAERPVALTVAPFQSEGRELLSIHVTDLAPIANRDAQLGALRAQMAHAARISAMGQLSAAIVHEMAQPLSATRNYASALRRTAGEDLPETVQCGLKAIEREVERATEITARLRRFAQKGSEVRQPERLVDLLDEAVQIATLDNRKLKVRKVYSAGIGEAVCDRIQLQQVLVNLLRNAIAATASVPDPQIVLKAKRHQGRIAVTVEDNGPGVDVEDIAVLFLPFNTSKIDGMGLGLAISKSIVEAHGGHMWYEPGASRGAVFGFDFEAQPQ